MTLEAHSFELFYQKTSLSTDDFYNHPERITYVYCAEMVDVIMNVPPADDEQTVRVPKTGEQVKRTCTG